MTNKLEWWIRTMLRHRIKTLAMVLMVTGLAGLLFSQLEIRTALLDMIKKSSERAETYETMRQHFGSDTIMLVGIDDDELSSPAGIERLRKLTTIMKQHPLVGEVSSLINLQRIDPKGGSLKVEHFIAKGANNQTQINSAFKALRDDGLFVPTFLSHDGKATAIIAELASGIEDTKNPEVWAEMEKYAATIPGGRKLLVSREGKLSLLEGARMDAAMQAYSWSERAGYKRSQVYPTGMPVAAGFLLAETERHMGPFFGFTLLIIAFLLGFLLRSGKAVIYCLVVALLAVLWAVGFGGTINGRISIVAAMAPIIVLVLAVANVVHLVGQYRFERHRTDSEEALIATFREVGTACFLTSLTTLIGFSSLYFIPLVTAQELGVVCAVGVVAAFILTFTVVPIMISYFDLPAEVPTTSKRTFAILNWCQDVARKAPRRVLGASALATMLALAGLNMLVIDTNLDAKFYDDHPVAQAARFFSERLSGGVSAELLIDTGRAGGALERDQFISQVEGAAVALTNDETDEGFGLDDDDDDDEEEAAAAPRIREQIDSLQGAKANLYLEQLKAVGEELKAFRDPNILDGKPIVLGAFSLADIAERTHKAMGGEGDLPNRAQFAAQLALFEGEGGEGMDSFVDEERRYLRMQLRMPSLGTRNTVAFMKAIEPGLQQRFPTPPGGMKTQINGIDVLLADVIEALGIQLYVGFAFAALIITLVMGLVYGSWKVGLASMLPNILPVISGIGILGLIGLKIDIDALIMVSIALGIAVDDTIHFLTRYKLEREAGKDKDSAIRLSLHETGVGIVRTSIILMLGFGIFLFSPYLTFKYVGLILPTTMGMAVVADMLVVPAMVYLNWIPVVAED
jgi:predicted RND superfamily exporter protein